jgi:hypothetical protein
MPDRSEVLAQAVCALSAGVAAVQYKPLILLVRAGRLELPRPFGQQILSLPRLPFRHARRWGSLQRSLPLGHTRDKRSRWAQIIAAGES